jgi:hypothetical protein
MLAGRRLTYRPSIVIDTGVDDDRANVVIISNRLFQGLENETSDAFASRKARGGAVIKGKGLSIGIEDTLYCQQAARATAKFSEQAIVGNSP